MDKRRPLRARVLLSGASAPRDELLDAPIDELWKARSATLDELLDAKDHPNVSATSEAVPHDTENAHLSRHGPFLSLKLEPVHRLGVE